MCCGTAQNRESRTLSTMGASYYPLCYDRIYDPALNGTEILDPIQEDIEEYLNNFLAGKNCRE